MFPSTTNAIFGTTVAGGASTLLVDNTQTISPVSVPIGPNAGFREVRPTVAINSGGTVAFAGSLGSLALFRGGVFTVADQRVSATGVDNPLIALTLLGTLRYLALRRVPLFGLERWPMTSLESGARSILIEHLRRIETMTPRGATRVGALGVALAIVVKAVLAWSYPGFFSGDDVEIHEMSIGALWSARWPIWDLRNAFFPLGVFE